MCICEFHGGIVLFTITGVAIRYASDCSGVESFMEAFKRLGVQQRVQLQFCSDIDVDCRTCLREMHGAQFNDQCNIYKDLKQRKLNRNTQPHIYTVVIPSYSWSSAGKGEGESDSQGREDFQASWRSFRRPSHKCSSWRM